MHVRRDLDPEDPVHEVKRWRQRLAHTGHLDRRRRHNRGRCKCDRLKRNESAGLRLFRRTGPRKCLGEGLRAAVARAIARGHLLRHRAIGTHAAGGHGAIGNASRARTQQARQTSQSGLNRQKADDQDGCELGESLHALVSRVWISFARVCELDHIGRSKIWTGTEAHFLAGEV